MPLLVALGLASVAYWAARDDLRFYGVVQFYPLLAIPLLVWLCPAMYSDGAYLYAALGCYVVAKLLEEHDIGVHSVIGAVSGHTLKHLTAAAGAWLIHWMHVVRRPLGSLGSSNN